MSRECRDDGPVATRLAFDGVPDDRTGFPAASRRLRRSLRGAGKDAGLLEGYTWHCNATRSPLGSSWPAWTCSRSRQLGGGRTVAMVTRYAHLAPDHLRSAVERLSGVELGVTWTCRPQRISPASSKCAILKARRASLNWQGSGLEIHRAARPLGVRIPRPPPISREFASSIASLPSSDSGDCAHRCARPRLDRREFIGGRPKVGIVHDRVPAIDRFRLVAGELHGHGPRHAGSLKVADCGASKVVEDPRRHAGRFARSLPRPADDERLVLAS